MLSSSGLSSAAELSNQGVVHLREGRYEEAAAILARALLLTKRQFDSSEHDEQADETIVDMDKLVAQNSVASSQWAQQQQEAKQGKAIYHCAFAIPPSTPRSKDSMDAEVATTSAVKGIIIIYNLALSYHLASKTETTMERRIFYLQKAAKLYDLAYNLHVEENRMNTIVGSALFALATVNNLGLVHHDLNDMVLSKHCFQHVLSTMMCITDYQQHRILPEEVFEIFIHNASTFTLQTNTVATAA